MASAIVIRSYRFIRVTVSQLVLIDQAVQESDYEKNYIRYLARKGFIQGKKQGGIWLVDLDSLKEYETRMKAEGTQKHNPTRHKEIDE